MQPLLAATKSKLRLASTNILHTRISYQGRLCTTILMKAAVRICHLPSQERVDKLRFKTERHPNAYRVAWSIDTSIPVSFSCLLTFLIRTLRSQFGVMSCPWRLVLSNWKTLALWLWGDARWLREYVYSCAQQACEGFTTYEGNSTSNSIDKETACYSLHVNLSTKAKITTLYSLLWHTR